MHSISRKGINGTYRDRLCEPRSRRCLTTPDINFRQQKRSNQAHESLTDSDARPYKKARGPEAKLACLGHVIKENRNGLVVDMRPTLAAGTVERDAAIAILEQKPAGRRVTLGGNRGYDTKGFAEELRGLHVTPQVAQNKPPAKRIHERTARHGGGKCKRVEEVFGWLKTVVLPHKTRFRGPGRGGPAALRRGHRDLLRASTPPRQTPETLG